MSLPHPGVISAEETAIFFDTYVSIRQGQPTGLGMLESLENLPPATLRRGLAWYFRALRGFLGHPVGDRLMIDKNPSLTTLVPASVRLVPGVRFVSALRDPRDVCLSCFMQSLPLNPTSASYLTLEDTAVEYASVMGLW